ncbi:probable polyol transporter 4 isoform X1 [Salvia miltiorrhiza]|uniref:probable polyol transporter 4 isoform X1 n=1 Tax=Salvia miltiorrhiza TaxID=226208 RepID=UPI0025ACF313|nr:probable polyol transporter 4 isoform X1 [Salvia miltiorrhiza]XP_057764562.1 probable polyol transporter 4 isoform X1 [Salvia miltiorrhiza]
MGLQENGKGSVRKYRSMDEDVSVSHPFQENGSIRNRRSSSSNYVMACAIFASLNSVLLGYDVGVMSGAILFIQEDLKISEVQEEVFVGILSIISLLGSLAGGKTSDAIGRKWTIAFAAIVFQSGAGVMALASSFTVLMMGRLLAGIGIGFGVMITPVYIAEIAPTVTRGSLTSFPEIFTNLGILLGYISNYAFSGLPAHINWRIMLAVGIIPSIFIGGALFVIPESPRWLVMQNRIDEARNVLLKTNDNAGEVEGKLAEIQEAAKFMTKDRSEEKAVWREMLNPTPGVRRMLITGCGIQIFQQITGIDATVYYSPTIFKNAGIKGNTQLLAATVAVGFTKTIFILIAIFLIDKAGRKPLLYVSTVGMTVCLLTLGLTLSTTGNSEFGIALAILCVCGNVAFFSVGIGPICWVVSSEIFPLKLRAQASAIGSVGSRVSSGVIAMSFLSVNHAITVGGTFMVFAAISALSVAFVYKYVPETKGKSLEQIEMLFQNDSYWEHGQVELEDVQHLIPNE